jgi:outer membrane receptor protein involved in Fe transport
MAAYSHLDQRVEFTEEDPDETPNQRIAEQRGRLGASLPLGRSRLEVTGGYERNRRREFEDEAATDVAVGLLSKTYLGTAHLHHFLAPNVGGVLGVSGYRNRFDKFGSETLIPNSTADNVGVFVFEQVEAGRWNLSLGGRFDHRRLDVESDADIGVTAQTRTYNSATGSVGVLLRAAEPVALVLNVGRGFRAPSSFELFANGVHEGTLAFERGNPALRTEKSLNTDFAIRLSTSNASGEVGGFVNQVRDFIFTVPSGTTDSASGLQIYQVEQGDARLAGFEGALEYHPTSFLHLRGTADYVAGQNTTTGQPLPSIPPFRATYTVRLEGEGTSVLARPYLSVGGETHARQTRLDPAEREFFAQAFDGAGYQPRGYTLVHLAAGFASRAGAMELHFGVQVRNVLDQPHADFLSRLKTSAPNPGPGRSVTLRLTSEF